MKKLILNGMISTMMMILGFGQAIAGTSVGFTFQSNPTDAQIFAGTVMVLKHYRFDIRREDAEVLSIRAVRKITKENVYYLEYSINIKEKQLSVLVNVTEYNPDAGIPRGTVSGAKVFGKTVSKETPVSDKWRLEKELHDARWLIGKLIRNIGTRLDESEFKSQIRK